MTQDKPRSTLPQDGLRVKKEDPLSQRLAKLAKKFAESGRRLTNGTVNGKSMGFIGGVRQPVEKDRKDE